MPRGPIPSGRRQILFFLKDEASPGGVRREMGISHCRDTMNQPTHPPSLEPRFKTGQVIAGVSLAVVWGLLHVVLFYFVAVSGIIFVAFLEGLLTFLFPGRAINSPMGSLDWILPLQIGLTLGGIAGIPAGLAIFWRARRKLLWTLFGVAFLGALIFEIYAVVRLFSDTFRPF